MVGKSEVQKLFDAAAKLQAADDNAEFKVARVTGDVVVEEWSHKTPDGATLSGADVIVVRNGKIAFHTTQLATSSGAAK